MMNVSGRSFMRSGLIVAILLLFLATPLFSKTQDQLKQTQVQMDKNARMKWRREARFGMFIHWGVYSVYGNVYNGVDVTGKNIHYNMANTGMPSEWIMHGAKIPRSIYREAATQFDAADYNPKEWVRIAKEAGMKYIVIASKHHDGFCLFETKFTNWNAVEASAAKKDLLKDLVTEAKNAGLKIGFYYSQNLDWMQPGGMWNIPELNYAEYSDEEKKQYVKNIVIPHLEELTSHYDIDLIWFDSPWANANNALAQQILDAALNSPLGGKLIFNDRLGGNFKGDFSTPETDNPDIPYNGYDDNNDWEACASLSNSWGWEDTPDGAWKTPLYSISRILELASKGGNFLLNVGPDKHGIIPSGAQNTLKEVGIWMSGYGNTVYGTSKNELLNPFQYGYVTQRNNSDGSVNMYLHVSSYYWQNMRNITLPGVMELPEKTVLFNSNEQIPVVLTKNGLEFTLPSEMPNQYYSVIDLSFKKKPEQKPVALMDEKQEIHLTPYQAVLKGGLKKDYLPYAIKDWYYYDECTASWKIYLTPGSYSVEVELATWDKGEIEFEIDGTKYTGHYPKTKQGIDTPYVKLDFPDINFEIKNGGFYTLNVKNKKLTGIFNIIQLRNIVLKRDSASGIEEVTNNQLKIYPNPSKDYFILETNTKQKIGVFTLDGRLLKSFNSNYYDRVDISTFKPGCYLVKGHKFVQKLIVY